MVFLTARGLIRLLAGCALPVAFCLLAWIPSRASKRRLRDEAPLLESIASVEETGLGGGDSVAVPSVSSREKKRLEKAAERERRASMTEEEKAEEKAKRAQAAIVKFDKKRVAAVALVAKLRELFSKACPESPIFLAALDVEAWEDEPEKVTEIGLAMAEIAFFDPSEDIPLPPDVFFRHRHILIREHLELRNGKHVEDNKDNFLFGDSEVLCLTEAANEVAAELNKAAILVGHAVRGDLAWLRKIGVSGLDANSSSLETRLVDTQCLAFAAAGIDVYSPPQLGLGPVAEGYGLNPQMLHNGANDAAFTLQVMLLQCGVLFTPPTRSFSNHMISEAFQIAWAEALTRLDASRIASLQREQELRFQVMEFVARNVLAADKGKEDVILFPADLTSKERKLVHRLAEENGLQSFSTDDGPNGERRVSIFNGAADADKQAWQSRRGKKHKMTRAQWKAHNKDVAIGWSQANVTKQDGQTHTPAAAL